MITHGEIKTLVDKLDAVCEPLLECDYLAFGETSNLLERCGNEIAKLTDERDALKKDAERYRFLKKGFGRCSFEIMEQSEEDGEYYGVSLVQGNYIDDKIDAAMKETK